MAPPKRYHLVPKPVLDEQAAATPAGRLLAAASIASRLLQLARVHRWHELGRDLSAVPAHVMLEPDQAAALAEHDEVLHQLYQPVDKDNDPPAVFLQVCLGCGSWSLASTPRGKSGGTTKKCNLTLQCPGPTTKASVASTRPQIALGKDKDPDA
ncbi:hypothetical protein [Cellulosimicrobium sp. Marseille-Q4280]|uniref:hypothetical protein n=1 Tax=Cellulosimicrobium sp. Marseille-Q4280 TaxID=2937992 RepID=UPI00203B7358|nr:hypothetical protein [Cellulosimicrobium sp. Marseille-Q4280]